MLKHNSLKNIGLVFLVLVLVIIPFIISEYYVYVLITLLIYTIVVVSFRLITTIGCWSLAHIPMMGVGGYTAAIFATKFGWPCGATIFLGGFVALAVGLVLSYPLARIKGFSFFIASYAFGEAIRLAWTRIRKPFGGHFGICGIPSAGTISLSSLKILDFARPIPNYFLVLVVGAVCLLLMYRLEKSRIGDTFKAIASDENLSRSVGINILGYKRMAFSIGCFFAGIAGVLFAHYYRFVDPASFGMVNTMYLLVWSIVGGVSTFLGPIIGVAVLTGIYELLRPLAEWIPLFYGIILILTLRFLPGGLESVPERITKWRIQRRTKMPALEVSSGEEASK
jgi:branched-chain amino acid transport system permease protein